MGVFIVVATSSSFWGNPSDLAIGKSRGLCKNKVALEDEATLCDIGIFTGSQRRPRLASIFEIEKPREPSPTVIPKLPKSDCHHYSRPNHYVPLQKNITQLSNHMSRTVKQSPNKKTQNDRNGEKSNTISILKRT